MRNVFDFASAITKPQNKMEELKMEITKEMLSPNAEQSTEQHNQNVDKEVVETMQQLEESIKAEQTAVAHLAIKKSYGQDLVDLIVSSNYNAEQGENETHYLIHAPYIRIVRSDVENVIGKLTNTRWRMLFAHRQGELKTFNDYEFTIGNPIQTSDEPVSKEETSQINVRCPLSLKAEVDEFKDMMNLSVNSFMLNAVNEYIKQLKKEME